MQQYTQTIKAGELFRVEKGIYSSNEYVPELAIISHKYEVPVLFIHGEDDDLILPKNSEDMSKKQSLKRKRTETYINNKAVVITRCMV